MTARVSAPAGSRGHATPTLREWLREAPFGLAMSSGFFGFFAHTGLLTVLEDEALLPVRVSGSSAGALVTGAWAAGVDAIALAAELQRLTRGDFWDPSPGFGLLRGDLFRGKLEELLGARGFSRCRVPAAISVHAPLARSANKTRVLEDGDLAAAIHASCAVPLLFHPVRIDGSLYVDGGVSDRPGLAGMPSGTRVLFHHLASRSPWRRFDLESMRIPARDDMLTLVMDGLPRSGPFRLEAGRRAFDAARRAAKRALGERVSGARLDVDARRV
jgi:NTE family protein